MSGWNVSLRIRTMTAQTRDIDLPVIKTKAALANECQAHKGGWNTKQRLLRTYRTKFAVPTALRNALSIPRVLDFVPIAGE